MNNLRTIGGGAGQVAVAYAEPPVSPPVSRPMGTASVHAATPVTPMTQVASVAPSSEPPAQAVAPPAPAPAVEPSAPVQEEPVDETIAVFLNLKSGERVWAGRFDTLQLAEVRAHEIVRGLIRPEPGVWARFGNRLIRPTAVVSIELAPRRED